MKNKKLNKKIILSVVIVIIISFTLISLVNADEEWDWEDMDGDGIPNCEDEDVDGDGINNDVEFLVTFTNPYDPDTDGDGMDDGEEFEYWLSRGLNYWECVVAVHDDDCDDDGILDGDELYLGYDPLNPDSDGDGKTDRNEDADGDGINDYNELYIYLSDPLNRDSDGDGLLDGVELTYGLDPSKADSDGDAIDDLDEIEYWWNRGINPFADLDGDGIVNIRDPDADGDGWWDYYEIWKGWDPAVNEDEVEPGYGIAYCPFSFFPDDDEEPDDEEVVTVTLAPTPVTVSPVPVASVGLACPSSYASITSIRTTDQINDAPTGYRLMLQMGNCFQSFTPQVVSLNAVDLRLIVNELPDEGYNTTIIIRADRPDGQVLGSVTKFIQGPIKGEQEVEVKFEFSEAISLIPGETYVIEWIRPLSGQGFALAWAGTHVDPYSEGTALSPSGYPIIGYDYIFTTYTSSLPVSIPSNGEMEVEITYTPTILEHSFGTLEIICDEPSDLEVILSGALALDDDDNDDLTNTQELLMGTDLGDPDTDGDGITDGDEFYIYFTKLKNPDTDWDGLNDADELFIYETDARDSDTDDDGLNDGDEIIVYGTDPFDLDTDGDGVIDGDEVDVGTDPLNPVDTYTPTGTYVIVQDDTTGVTVTYDHIFYSGITTITPVETTPPLPTGISDTGSVISISTTATTYSEPITISLPYEESQVSNENNLFLGHWNTGTGKWEDITTEVDTVENVAYAVTFSLSTFAVLEDVAPPSIVLETPTGGTALQDGINFQITATDFSEVKWVNINISDLEGNQLIMSATPTSNDGWHLLFDTTELPDGYYQIVIEASDKFGNTASTSPTSVSIRNWVTLELLPATVENKAGRTMPVKFSLRVLESVDTSKPFVVNQELDIEIFDKNTGQFLQHSTFGDHSTDYRINEDIELYITNFKTSRTPTTYIVEISRKGFLIGSFEFTTSSDPLKESIENYVIIEKLEPEIQQTPVMLGYNIFFLLAIQSVITIFLSKKLNIS